MNKIKFTIIGEFPAEDVLVYAVARGYKPELPNSEVGEDVPASIPNPQSATDYVAQFIKNILIKEVSGVTETKIRADCDIELQNRISELHNSVKRNISVKV